MDEGKISITIRLTKEFHKRLKFLAVEKDTTIKGLFMQSMGKLLEEEESKKKG